nr:CcdC protein domain-containing protein [Rhodococcus sp. (in: high G+C Gram-positive bacteria)]
MNIASIVIIAALVVYLLVRRMSGQLMEARRMLVIPAIVVVIGLSTLGTAGETSGGSAGITPTAVGFLAFGVLIGAALGAVRGFTVRLVERDGYAWMKYSALTLALWVAAIAVRLIAVPVESAIDSGAAATAGQAFALSIGAGLLAESLVVLYRATHGSSRIVWRASKTGDHAIWRHQGNPVAH